MTAELIINIFSVLVNWLILKSDWFRQWGRLRGLRRCVWSRDQERPCRWRTGPTDPRRNRSSVADEAVAILRGMCRRRGSPTAAAPLQWMTSSTKVESLPRMTIGSTSVRTAPSFMACTCTSTWTWSLREWVDLGPGALATGYQGERRTTWRCTLAPAWRWAGGVVHSRLISEKQRFGYHLIPMCIITCLWVASQLAHLIVTKRYSKHKEGTMAKLS